MLSLLWPSWTTPSSIKNLSFAPPASNSTTLSPSAHVLNHTDSIMTDIIGTISRIERATSGTCELEKILPL